MRGPATARRVVTCCLAVAAVVGLPAEAGAHAIDPGAAIVRVDGAEVRLSITPPAAAFPDADANGDGRIDDTELSAARADVLAMFHDSVRLRAGDPDRTSAPTVTFDDVLVPHDHNGGPEGSNLWFVVQYRFAEPPLPLRFEYRLAGGPIEVTVGDVTGVEPEEPGTPIEASVIGRGAVSVDEPVVLFAPETPASQDDGGAATRGPWIWAGAALVVVVVALIAFRRSGRARARGG